MSGQRDWRLELRDAVLTPGAALSPSARLVVCAIANYANGKSRLGWPSIATLAAATGWSERTVQRALRELVRQGWLEVQTMGHGRRATEYRVTWPRWVHQLREAHPDSWLDLLRGASGTALDVGKGDSLTPLGGAEGDALSPTGDSVSPQTRQGDTPTREEPEIGTRDRLEPPYVGSSRRVPRKNADDAPAVLDDTRESWLRNMGVHYAHDPQVFAEELARALGVRDGMLVSVLRKRAQAVAESLEPEPTAPPPGGGKARWTRPIRPTEAAER